MTTLTTEAYNKSVKENKNPFTYHICGKHAKKIEKAETVANFIWEVENICGACTYGDLFNHFKTWSSDTIEAGCKMFNDFKWGF